MRDIDRRRPAHRPGIVTGVFVALCLAAPPAAALVCGDGLPDAAESCDDGNTTAGDGCSASCQVETGYACTAAAGGTPLNAIEGGDFETAQSAWITASAQYPTPLCDAASCGASGVAAANGGAGWLWLGGAAAPESAWAEQTVSLAPADTTITFAVSLAACDSAADTLTVTLDGNVVYGAAGDDPNCGEDVYRSIAIDLATAPGGPYNDGLPHTLRFEAQTLAANGGISSFLIDDVLLARGTAPPAPSVCTLQPAVCHSEDFDPGVGGDLGLIGWSSFGGAGDVSGVRWGTSDDGVCASANVPAGNHTGGAGHAACADSDAADAGATDTWLCSPAYDLTGVSGARVRLRYAWQPYGPPGTDDRFSVHAGTAAPSPATVGAYALLLEDDGSAARTNAGLPASDATLDASAFDGAASLHVCIRYAGDFDWAAQVDDVAVVADACQAIDTDGDGVLDGADNCTALPNPLQTDTDGDAIGNVCDQDIAVPNDCVVNVLDLAAFRAAFLSTPASPNWNPDADFVGITGAPDGAVNVIDLGRLKAAFFQPPGPSAAGCH